MSSGSALLCPLPTFNGVLFQAGVSKVFLIAVFVKELPEMTRQCYTIHIGVGALWAPIVLRMSPSVISRALEWYGWTGLAWIKWPGIDEQSGFSAWFQGQREVENCSSAPIRYANGHISPHWDLMHNLPGKW